MNTLIRLTIILSFLIGAQVIADDTKSLIYTLDHTKLAGSTDNASAAYKQSIIVGLLSSMVASGYVAKNPSTYPTDLVEPQYLRINNKKGNRLPSGKDSIQVKQENCTLPRFDANVSGYYRYDACPSLNYTFGSIPK